MTDDIASPALLAAAQAALDESAASERWYALSEGPQQLISVEAAPRHYPTKESWAFRAVAISNSVRGSLPPIEVCTADRPLQALQEAVSEVKGYTVELSEIEQMLAHGPAVVGHPNSQKDASRERAKPLPELAIDGFISLHAPMQRYAQEEASSDSWSLVTCEYDLHGFSHGGKGIDVEPVPLAAGADRAAKEAFVVTRTYDTGDTFSATIGRKQFLAAFTDESAADEYCAYEAARAPDAYFDSKGEFTVERVGALERAA